VPLMSSTGTQVGGGEKTSLAKEKVSSYASPRLPTDAYGPRGKTSLDAPVGVEINGNHKLNVTVEETTVKWILF